MAASFWTRTYELWQHIVAFIVMAVCRLSSRRVEKFLSILGIKVSTFSALCKSRKRISPTLFQRAMTLTTGYPHQCVAINSAGFSTANPSYHYVKRIGRKKPIKSFVKQSSVFDMKNKTFVALRVRAKPRHDIRDVKYLLKRADVQTTLLGDTDYDAEWLHELCFERKIQTQIKPRKNVRRGFYRRKQMKNYSEEEYIGEV